MIPFEWYYFDVHDDQGYDMVFTLHTRPFMSVFEISIFDIFIYRDNKPLHHYFFVRPFNEMKYSDNPFLIEYDEKNYIKKINDEIEVRFADPKIDLHFKFQNLLPKQEAIRVALHPPGDAEKYFIWILFAPRCTATGKITCRNETLEVTGRGYHDYNSGNINLKKKLSYWHWAKFFNGDFLQIFGHVILKSGFQRMIFVRADNKSIRLDENPQRDKSGSILKIESRIGSLKFKAHKTHPIDDLRFYVSVFPKPLLILAKIREIAASLALVYRPLRFFKGILTNGRYLRKRILGEVNGKQEIESFHEEMFF